MSRLLTAKRLAAIFIVIQLLTANALADESLSFDLPDPSTVPAGDRYRVIATLTDGEEPLAYRKLYVQSTIGSPVTRSYVTSSKGKAEIQIASGLSGSGQSTVRTGLGFEAQFDVTFSEAPDEQLFLTPSFYSATPGSQILLYVKVIDSTLAPAAGIDVNVSLEDADAGSLNVDSNVTNTSGEVEFELNLDDLVAVGSDVVVHATADTEAASSSTVSINMVADVVDELVFIRPADPGEPELFEIDIGVKQLIEVLWTRNGRAVQNQAVLLGTELGTLSDVDDVTDNAGLLRGFIDSPISGTTVIGAAGEDAVAEVTVVFQSTVLENDFYVSRGQPILLSLANDRIGFQARTDATREQIAAVVAAEDATVVSDFYRDIYVLALPESVSRDTIQDIARFLENTYPTVIQRAGIVATAANAVGPYLLTDQILVRYQGTNTLPNPGPVKAAMKLADIRNVTPGSRRFIATMDPRFSWQILTKASAFQVAGAPPVMYSHPNFILPINRRDSADGQGENQPTAPPQLPVLETTTDPWLNDQWHHKNMGLYGQLQDADMDTVEAWGMSDGSQNHTMVAVIDSGFSVTHPDLVSNLWTDANGYHGRDFSDNMHDSLLDDPVYPSLHGTAVAGIIGATANNTVGGRGVCPGCELLLLRHGGESASIGTALEFVLDFEDDFPGDGPIRVLSNSWAPDNVFDDIEILLLELADNPDVTVLFAMESVDYKDNCIGIPDISSAPHVMAVSSVTDQDKRTPSGFGDCMDVLGPTRGGVEGITTTGIQHVSGSVYNSMIWTFGGTSAAAPMVSGLAGLIVDQDPSLSRVQVQRILQDTADRVEPGVGEYELESGFSSPPGSESSSHGYGRINAQEAVALVAPFVIGEAAITKRGHGGKDLLLRDHAWDWGNTIEPSSTMFNSPRTENIEHRSVDIKIDVEPFQIAIVGGEPSPQDFLDLNHEEPVVGERARAYVRLRNRGPTRIDSADVKLHTAIVGDTFPMLPDDFWSVFPDDSTFNSEWQPIPYATLTDVNYSGASIAGCPDRDIPECIPDATVAILVSSIIDRTRISVFDLPAMGWDETSGEHLALLAVTNSTEDPVLGKLVAAAPAGILDVLTAATLDNNVTLWHTADDGGGGGEECDQTIIIIIIILLTLLALLLLYVIIKLISGQQVPTWVYQTIIVLLVALIIIAILMPECFAIAINLMGL